MKRIIRYAQLWWKLTVNSFLVSFSSRVSALLFLIGKILRFLFFIVFLLTIFTQTKLLADYSVLQMLFFFLTFTVIDTATQLFFREVYRFRPMVVSGDFDLVLVKPINPLFRALAGGADPLDLLMLLPYTALLAYIGVRVGPVTAGTMLSYGLLLVNAMMIAAGFHILVLSLAILTTEIDHAIMIYRDLTSMGRIPVDIYREPLRSVLTFVVPVGVMMTFPAKVFMGLLTPAAIVFSLVIGCVFLWVCTRVWHYALTQYSSASS